MPTQLDDHLADWFSKGISLQDAADLAQVDVSTLTGRMAERFLIEDFTEYVRETIGVEPPRQFVETVVRQMRALSANRPTTAGAIA
jgi:hypothetical protein